jgi:AcrR family transcriptional regulator
MMPGGAGHVKAISSAQNDLTMPRDSPTMAPTLFPQLKSHTMGKLSGSHDTDAAGLPRGRSSLSPAETREAQRRRLVRAAISAFAELGYAATTIADIVNRARVSRQVFYELFETKEDCFLAAEALGREALLTGLMPSLGQNLSLGDGWLRAPVRAYLRICAEEKQFARAWTVEFPTAGPRTLARRNAFFIELAGMLRVGHGLVRAQAPETWTVIPDAFYEAAIGGAFELIFRCVSQDRYTELPALEDTIVGFMLTTLGQRPAR